VDVADNHIDASVLPAALQQWDVIRCEWLDQPVEVIEDGAPLLASPSICSGFHCVTPDIHRDSSQDFHL
jgi:hypothetical protein